MKKPDSIRCYVYRSPRKKEAFLFLSQRDDFSDLPPALLEVFGQPEFSFAFELSSERSLVRENSAEVMENIDTRGFHLQMPPEHAWVL